jgi:hypothetical protein
VVECPGPLWAHHQKGAVVRKLMTLNSTTGHHVLGASRICGHGDVMWCTQMVENPFAYATKRRPRPKELLST